MLTSFGFGSIRPCCSPQNLSRAGTKLVSHSFLFLSLLTPHSLKFLPSRKITLGVPFYGRKVSDGDWVTYEDIVQRHNPLDPALDSVVGIGFNGIATIRKKVKVGGL